MYSWILLTNISCRDFVSVFIRDVGLEFTFNMFDFDIGITLAS